MDWQRLERELAQLPLFQYALLKPEELPFSSRVQEVCRQNCPMYGKSWSCPPAVGSVEGCRQRCLTYPSALLLVTVSEVADNNNLELCLQTRPQHTQQVRTVAECLHAQGQRTFCLSGDSCAQCASCAYPDACREPAAQMPCLEGYGVIVSELAARYAIPFPPEQGLVFWYAVILFGPAILPPQ